MSEEKIVGLKLIALDNKGNEIEKFAVFFKGEYAFGYSENWNTTERQIYTLQVKKET